MIKMALNLLKPAPHLPEIQDAELVKETYKYWRIRIFSSMYAGYLFYYFTRKLFSPLAGFLLRDAHLNLNYSDIGMLASILAITYGVSKFISSTLVDRSNPRYFMAIGLILTAVFNICFGCSSSFWLFALFFGLNGWFQGWGWPACTKQLTHWFSHSERGRWWGTFCTSHTAGTFIIFIAGPLIAQGFGWRLGMIIPSVFCVVMGFWLLNRLRDVPQSLGLPSIEKFNQEPEPEKKDETEILSIKEILLKHVLNNKYVWILAISYCLVYILRDAIGGSWGVLYLEEAKGYTPVVAGSCVAWFEVGGFFGVLVGGWGSDKWFDKKRVPLIVLSSFALIFVAGGLWYLIPNLLVTSLWLALLGFLVFIPQMLVGLAAAECVSKNAAASANGFAGFCAYVGAAIAGWPLGKVIEIWGWYGFVIALAVCAALCMLILLPVWSLRAGSYVGPVAPAQTPPASSQTEAIA